MPTRKAEAVWEGNLRQGHGTMKMASGAYEGPFSFSSRFEEGKGTNPEELIAAAHAGCFSMALSAGLAGAGFTPQNVHSTASVHIDKVGDGFQITHIDLYTEAVVPGIGEEQFQDIAEATKKGCPVSRALSAVEITLRSRIVAMSFCEPRSCIGRLSS